MRRKEDNLMWILMIMVAATFLVVMLTKPSKALESSEPEVPPAWFCDYWSSCPRRNAREYVLVFDKEENFCVYCGCRESWWSLSRKK